MEKKFKDLQKEYIEINRRCKHADIGQGEWEDLLKRVEKLEGLIEK